MRAPSIASNEIAMRAKARTICFSAQATRLVSGAIADSGRWLMGIFTRAFEPVR